LALRYAPGYARVHPGEVTGFGEGFNGARPQQESGRRSYCKACDRRRGNAYYDVRRDEFYAQRLAAREAAREAELKALEKEHRKRVTAAKKLHAAQVRRQKEFLRSIGAPVLSQEEISERARRPALPQAFRLELGGDQFARPPPSWCRYRKLLIQARISGWSMRYEKPESAQLLLSTNEFTARIVVPYRTGPPESPKHSPPWCG
jgi:hypothetical protein